MATTEPRKRGSGKGARKRSEPEGFEDATLPPERPRGGGDATIVTPAKRVRIPRSPARAHATPSPPAAPEARGGGAGAPALLSDLLRGPLQMVGQVTGIDTAARALERLAVSADRTAEILDRVSADRLDRLAASAERAAAMLDRLDEEVGVERIINVVGRLERLSETADQMNRSLRAIERLALDLQKRLIEPLDRLPFRALRDSLGRAAPARKKT